MTLSDQGRKLLLDYEVGGGEPYYRKFLSRPTWPGEASGVTIGVGFDLGYNTESQVQEAWSSLADSSLELLKGSIGVRGESARLWLSITRRNRLPRLSPAACCSARGHT